MESTTMEQSKLSSETTKAAAIRVGTTEKSPTAGGGMDSVVPALLGHLLEMAHKYLRQGQIRQAMDIYWKFVDEYPESEQANDARATLLKLAQGYELDGKLHAARDIYEHLLQLQDARKNICFG